jgi:hypothetical protein
MSELERQASCPESPESKQASATEATRCSITSSALTSLLPIAAASGIVHANYDTPKISFYSPSGNLIQLEGSSSPVNTGSPTTATSNYSVSNRLPINSRSGTSCLPPPRPTLVPRTTPPITTAPLPNNLRHHHNYQHPERSQISSYESLIDSTTPVVGCGGVVRAHGTYPHNGIHPLPYTKTNPSLQDTHQRSTRSFIHGLRSDLGFYKSRYIALASQPRNPCAAKSTRKVPRTTLHKRQKVSYKEPAYTHYARPRVPLAQEPHASHKENSILGPLAGYAMRICFCQPYDGAGKAARADTSCTRQHMQQVPVAELDARGDDDEEGAARLVSWPRGDKNATCRSEARSGGGVRIKISAGVAVSADAADGT